MAITNITILSIFEIILLEFDYRTVNIFTNDQKSYHDVGHDMMNILKNYLKPTHILNFDADSFGRKRCEEPILNVLFVTNNTMPIAEQMRSNIYPNDISLILDFSPTEFNFQSSMQVSNKVLIMNNFSLLALNQFRQHEMDILPLHPFNIEKAKNFIKSYIRSTKHLKQRKLIIFFQYLTPRSMIATVEKGFFFHGADGSITTILLKMLNVTGVFVSDVGLIYPTTVQQWTMKDRKIIPRRENLYRYYKNAMTNNPISDFYRR